MLLWTYLEGTLLAFLGFCVCVCVVVVVIVVCPNACTDSTLLKYHFPFVIL